MLLVECWQLIEWVRFEVKCANAHAHLGTVLLEMEIGIKTIIMFVYILCLLFGDSLKASVG